MFCSFSSAKIEIIFHIDMVWLFFLLFVLVVQVGSDIIVCTGSLIKKSATG